MVRDKAKYVSSLSSLRFQDTKRFAVITAFRSRFLVKKRCVRWHPVVLQARAKYFVSQRIRVYYISLLTHNIIADVSFPIVGLRVRAVSVFGKKSDAACGFLAYFCAVLSVSHLPYAPL